MGASLDEEMEAPKTCLSTHAHNCNPSINRITLPKQEPWQFMTCTNQMEKVNLSSDQLNFFSQIMGKHSGHEIKLVRVTTRMNI